METSQIERSTTLFTKNLERPKLTNRKQRCCTRFQMSVDSCKQCEKIERNNVSIYSFRLRKKKKKEISNVVKNIYMGYILIKYQGDENKRFKVRSQLMTFTTHLKIIPTNNRAM
ncbi:hypothetical protein V6Z11_A12G220600 [Gossypium hirsutum]